MPSAATGDRSGWVESSPTASIWVNRQMHLALRTSSHVAWCTSHLWIWSAQNVISVIGNCTPWIADGTKKLIKILYAYYCTV